MSTFVDPGTQISPDKDDSVQESDKENVESRSQTTNTHPDPEWTYRGTFSSQSAALSYMAGMGEWQHRYNALKAATGMEHHYRCKRRQPFCQAQFYIFNPHWRTDNISLFIYFKPHTCGLQPEVKALARRIPDAVKAEISRLHSLGWKTNKIWIGYAQKKLKNMNQLYYCLSLGKAKNAVASSADQQQQEVDLIEIISDEVDSGESRPQAESQVEQKEENDGIETGDQEIKE